MRPPICHINLAKHFRGGERQTELLVRELAAAGWPQRLIIRAGNPLGSRLEDVALLEQREVSSNPVAAALACRGASLVHAHEARAVYSGWLSSVLFRIPYVLTRRVVNPQKPSGFRERAYRRASAAVAVSQAAAAAMQRQQNFLQPYVVPDASASLSVDSSAVAAIRDRFAGKTLIGHVGALEDATKGQRTLFEVARQAKATREDWQFVLVGDGNDRQAFETETEDLSNVHFEGFVDNVGDYLSAFDLFVFPSVQEAVGSTLLDAMQVGLPIVASRTGGIPEIIVDGRNGVLIEPRDADGFFAAIDVILDDTAERVRLRANNLDDAKKYAADAMAAAYLSIYNTVLG